MKFVYFKHLPILVSLVTFALIGMRVPAQAESADLVGGNIPNQTKFKINSVEPEILVIADPIFSQKQAVLLPESSEPESSTNLSNTTATQVAQTGVNIGFIDETEVGLLLGVGYTFSGF